MPGNILDVKVKAGASVKAGDVLVILEAMKMENEIVAPQDGNGGVRCGAPISFSIFMASRITSTSPALTDHRP